MVSIVIISHSHELAEGARAMASQMCQGRDVVITAAGGMEDGSIGTSFEKIERAVREAYSDDGVLILMDLGSAVMTTQMVVEMLEPDQQERVRLSNGPVVEGAIAAAAAAGAGQNLEEVQRSAETVLDEAPKVHSGVPWEEEIPEQLESGQEPGGPRFSADIVVPNPVGLHARPAMEFVRTASQFRAGITMKNLTRNRAAVDAKAPMQVTFGGTARQGETIRIVAMGEDAEEAVASLSALVESGFGEMEMAPSPSPTASAPSFTEIDVPAGPPPKHIRGLGVSEGYVVAPAFVYRPDDLLAESSSAGRPAAPEEELARLQEALQEARAQLEKLRMQVTEELDEKTGGIFEFQRMMLEDKQLVDQMASEIRTHGCTAEMAVHTVVSGWKEKAAALDSVMRARVIDLQDVENRLLRLLGGSKEEGWSRLTSPAIIVAADLTPSDTAQLDRTLVRGIATAIGGTTSHTAILARIWGIPAVMGLGGAVLAVPEKTRLALDGATGLVEVNPSKETAKAYTRRAEDFAELQAEALAKANDPALTRDGKRVAVFANVAGPDSVKEALRYGAEGIGLLRTEFLYLDRSSMPDEEEQYGVYREIVEMMGRRPVVIRTLDVGGDKHLPYIDIGPELNPFLGMRAIRLCLKRPDVFQPQLRAILRAGVGGNVKIMFPMVATLKEVHEAKIALSDARDSLVRRGVEYATDLEVGIMIETPAAAINADSFAREVDFLSIGSNDLTQYTLACDRGNRNMDYLFQTWDPAVMRLIRRAIEGAHAAGKWVGMCGEFAGELEAIPVLLGLGLDEFSVAAPRLPSVKKRIRELDSAECRAQVEEMFRRSLFVSDT